MERIKFNNCLNKPVRFWNISVGSIIGAVTFGVIILCFKGVLWAFAFGAIGFAIGGIVLHKWDLGIIQRKIYWHLPVSKSTVSENLPESYIRRLM